MKRFLRAEARPKRFSGSKKGSASPPKTTGINASLVKFQSEALRSKPTNWANLSASLNEGFPGSGLSGRPGRSASFPTAKPSGRQNRQRPAATEALPFGNRVAKLKRFLLDEPAEALPPARERRKRFGGSKKGSASTLKATGNEALRSRPPGNQIGRTNTVQQRPKRFPSRPGAKTEVLRPNSPARSASLLGRRENGFRREHRRAPQVLRPQAG